MISYSVLKKTPKNNALINAKMITIRECRCNQSKQLFALCMSCAFTIVWADNARSGFVILFGPSFEILIAKKDYLLDSKKQSIAEAKLVCYTTSLFCG